MSAPFLLTYATLARAAATWDDQAEVLRGGHKRLTDARSATGALGDRVAPVAERYLDTWLAQATTLAEAAQGRSVGLTSFMRSAAYFDASAAADIRAVLPWSERDLSGPMGPPRLVVPSPSPGPSPSPSPGPQP